MPDPELMRDAWDLYQRGRFSAQELDDMDALLLALYRKLMNAKVGRG